MPKYYSSEYISTINTCNKFGEKNILTDEISYDYINNCRNDENKCGKEGKYFEKDNYVELKKLKFKFISTIPYTVLLIYILISLLR